MEEINFINTQDLKQNYKLKKYVKLSILLAVAIIVALTIISVKQKNKLEKIKSDIKQNSLSTPGNAISVTGESQNTKTSTQQILQTSETGSVGATKTEIPITQYTQPEQNTQLKNAKIELKKQIENINNLKKTPKKETSILLNIYKIIPKEIEIKTISVTKNEFVVYAESNNDQSEKIANKVTKRIAKLQHIKTASLASIQKNNNKFVFQIKGEIKG